MGELRTRDQERRLRKAIQRVEAASDGSALTARLQRLAATLVSVRPGVTNNPQESKKHARSLARELGLDKETTRDLVLAAELHEIGKATSERDALYEPTELDPHDRAIVDSHAANAAELAAGIGRPEVVSALALQNERHDGTGPQGIGGDDLPFIAQALSVVAAYVAMTSKRPFRPALDRAHAIEVLRAEAGWQFDPYVVDAFIETLPQQRAATIAASAGASFARPVRSARLAYRRHGRASTVAVSSFSAAAILIGASTLAPGGISGAIERLGWPKQGGPGAVSGETTLIAAPSSGAIEGSTDPSTSAGASIGSADGDITGIAMTAGMQATETTEIEADYAYRAPTGFGAESRYTSYTAYREAEGDPAEAEGDPAEAEESEPSTTESSSPEGSTTEEAPQNNEQPEPEETTSPEPEETTSPEPEETTSPEPEETTTPEPEPSETSAPDGTSDPEPDEPAAPSEPEETPSDGEPAEEPATDEPTEPEPAPSDDEKEKKDKKDGPRGNARSSNGFAAYQPEEQESDLDDPESAENETDATESEEDSESTQTETESTEAEEAESTESAASTEPRDTTPSWGSIH